MDSNTTIRFATGTLLLAASLSACERPVAPAVETPEEHPLPLGEFVTNVSLPTYEHSGQSVHPDIATSPSWWSNGGRYLAITPYPNGDASKENPSLFVKMGAGEWSVPAGAPNPLRLPSTGYLSDPDIVFNPDTRELWMYYRGVAGKNTVYLIRSVDGVAWTQPVAVAEVPNHGLVSPAVVRRDAQHWQMWSVNAGASGCGATSTTVELRESADGRQWGAPRTVIMPTPPSGLHPWHIDVQWIPSRNEYWAVFNAKDNRSCGTTALYLATSPDGVAWSTLPSPILVAGETPELEHIVYRSTFEYDALNDAITFWYSGAKVGTITVWRTVARRVRREDLFGSALRASAMKVRAIPPGVNLVDPP